MVVNKDNIPIRVGQVWAEEDGLEFKLLGFDESVHWTRVTNDDGIHTYYTWRRNFDKCTLIHDPTTDAEQEPTQCRKCGNPHRLDDSDAGSDREMQRLCVSCFTPSRPKPIEPLDTRLFYHYDDKRLADKINELCEGFKWLTDKATGGEA